MIRGQDCVVDYINVGIQRCVLAIFMVKYGLPKIYGNFFDYQLYAMDSPLVAASDFQLAWYLYGLNPWQELFAGIMECIPGLMLLHRRTYYLGAVLLLPVVGHVFVLNLFFSIGGLTFPIASVLLLCNVAILWSQKPRIVSFIRSLDFSRTVHLTPNSSRVAMIGRCSVWTLLVAFIGLQTHGEFARSDERRTYDSLVGAYTLDAMSKNGEAFAPSRVVEFTRTSTLSGRLVGTYCEDSTTRPMPSY